MYEQTSEQLARAFRHAFIDGEMGLVDFMTRLADYGDARAREALAQREAVETVR